MSGHLAPGTHAYIVENGMRISRVIVLKSDRDFSLVAFDHKGHIRIRNSRLFPDKESAAETIRNIAT